MADTVVNTLYPPEIATFQPAFIKTESARITFSLSAFNSLEDINYIHVSIVDNSNNENFLRNYVSTTKENLDEYGVSNGILYIRVNKSREEETIVLGPSKFIIYDSNTDKYQLQLPWTNFLSELSKSQSWLINRYYKVQIRFDKNANLNNDMTNYMFEKRASFSEWSEVTLIKPISEPQVSLTEINNSIDKNNGYPAYQGFFRIVGTIDFPDDKTEYLQKYQIYVYGGEEYNNLIYNSDIIYAAPNYSDNNYGINTIIDLNDTTIGQIYLIKIIWTSNNEYSQIEERYIKITDWESFFSGTCYWNNDIAMDSKKIILNNEDGCAIINFSYEEENVRLPKGICYIYRLCSKDNFKQKEIIYRYEYEGDDGTGSISLNFSFEDYTICSLYQYKYYAQYEDISNNLWSVRHESEIIYPKFYDMLLMRQNRQIAIRYDGQISSWKPTVNRQKVDTLGGRYPKFVENAIMNYKTLEISGVIIAEEDFNRKFLNEFDDYYNIHMKQYEKEFGKNYLIRNDTEADGENLYPKENQIHSFIKDEDEDIIKTITGPDVYKNEDFSGQLFNEHDSYPHENWYWEREFREELVNWLNDGYPKLYRSMPEGNIPVMVTDINLTPKVELGRMIYDFSATLYEVGNGYSLEDLNRLGIINIPELSNNFIDTSTISSFTKKGFGQYYATGNLKLNDNEGAMNNLSDNNTSNNTSNDIISKISTNLKNQKYSNDEFNVKGLNLQNVKIQFITSPCYYTYNGEKWEKANGITDNTWLGYIFKLNDKDIFVNEKGYYQVPKNINVTSLDFYDNDNVLIDYEYTYVEMIENQNTENLESIINIFGQISNTFYPNNDIIDFLKEKYDSIILEDGQYVINQLDTIQTLDLDITPYSVLKITYDDDTQTNLYVGRTGVLNFSNDDIRIKNIKILGRRMVEEQIYNNIKDSSLREWEYRIDNETYDSINSIINPKYNTVYSFGEDNYKIYYINGYWYDVEYDDNNSFIIAKIPIEGMINYKVQVLVKTKSGG